MDQENREIAKQYKELLRISYQTLTPQDKKLIRSAFDVAVDAQEIRRSIYFPSHSRSQDRRI